MAFQRPRQLHEQPYDREPGGQLGRAQPLGCLAARTAPRGLAGHIPILATTLAGELIAGDELLFAAPLYNFGVSQHFKTWVDLAITNPRLAAGAAPILAGKPAVLITVRGGNYSAGTPREGWDHATGWMRRILADAWQLDLEIVETEFTLVGVNPALDPFKNLAAELRATAENQAREYGRRLTTITRAA